MKLLAILSLQFIFCVNAFAQSNPPPDPPECHWPRSFLGIDFGSFTVRNDCANNPIADQQRGDLGINGGMIYFPNFLNSFYLKTRVDMTGISFSKDSGYIHFAEFSQEINLTELPAIENMLIDLLLVSNGSELSLVVNYQTVGENNSGAEGEINSVVIPIHYSVKEFDLTIEWINLGCFTSTRTCEDSVGELGIWLESDGFSESRILGGLLYQESPKVFQQLGASYWGDLGRENMKGEVVLSYPE